ncbi:MAG: GtrA family protein [Wohlfahrtiimonas sp.]
MFLKYLSIGVLNTGLHWLIFGLCITLLTFDQSIANLMGFMVAVTFSFFMNAKFTFNKTPTSLKYILFTIFMGVLSYTIGLIADQLNLHPIITLISFSTLSLILGYLYSKWIVFK